MARVIYHPGTGTVVSADDCVLVDLDALGARLSVSAEEANVLLCEEDSDAQFAAAEVGVELQV